MYGQKPILIGNVSVDCKEMMFYQYLPIKFPGMSNPKYEDRLKCFDYLLGKIFCDYIGRCGLNAYVDSFIYLTAKRMYQKNEAFNRQGWHSDGFMTDDVSYIWCNKQPTVFNSSTFTLSEDDELSLKEMEEQAKPENSYVFRPNDILLLNQYVIHKVGKTETGMRTFVKVCFSKDKYDLEGNSHNYELIYYNWEMRPRKESRNIPQRIIKCG